MATPASQEDSERSFSTCGKFRSVKRASMKAEKLEMLVVCNKNKDLLEN